MPPPPTIKELGRDIAIKYDQWVRREGFEMQPCVEIGVRLRQQGYRKDMDKTNALL
jgi:hypothetical protein